MAANHYTLVGASCHLSWYGILEASVPIVQCLFMDLGALGGRAEEPRLRTFIVRGDRLPSAEVRAVHRASYASLASAVADAEERRRGIEHRSAVLARVLLEGSAIIRVLARTFTPVQIQTDPSGVEILEAVPALGFDAAALSHALSLYHVAKLVVIGSYPEIHDAVATSSSVSARVATGGHEDYATQAHKKLRRGYYAYDVAMSFRVGAHKYVLERDDAAAVVSRLFEVREVCFLRTCLRLVTPVGFVAVAVTDEQCCLLLKSAWTHLYDALFRGFAGQTPLRDYLGPDLFESGGARSFFFPGFPPVPIYVVNGLHALMRETALDAAGEVLSWCGLPDIVGPAGKLEVEPCELSLGVPDDEWQVFCGEGGRAVRLNATAFRERPAVTDLLQLQQQHRRSPPPPAHTTSSSSIARAHPSSDEDDNAPSSSSPSPSPSAVVSSSTGGAHPPHDDATFTVHVRDATLHRVVIVDLVECVLAKCIRGRDFNPYVRYSNRLHTHAVCERFIENLRYRSRRAFWQVHSLLGYISEHVTSACTAAGLSWVLSRGHREFYLYDGRSGHGPVSAEVCVRTVVDCYWRKLFGGDEPGPVCRVQESAPGVLLVWGGERLVGPFSFYGAGGALLGAGAVGSGGGGAGGGGGGGAAPPPHYHVPVGCCGGCCAGGGVRDEGGSPAAAPLLLGCCCAGGDWLSAVGHVLGRLPGLLRERVGVPELEAVYREILFRFVARRNDVDFWLLQFQPGENEVRPHAGVIDCAPFHGVWAERGQIIVQSRDAALAADIGYGVYVEKAFAMLTACIEVCAQDILSSSAAPAAVTAPVPTSSTRSPLLSSVLPPPAVLSPSSVPSCSSAATVTTTVTAAPSSSSSAAWDGDDEERDEWARSLGSDARKAARRVASEGLRFFRLNA
ncbi:helicase-primase subunit [Panine betaherpesvirus 2]|uniref:Helicase-primase subunit n=1 Tax=Panine betaherpesvirus 2 TaxID=188763 RepID=Q8QRZ9_9BETA|nr:helicase-primase subunit [Panine betaherpesvirus 2]AAM00739.1 helicase-primase subunit [Panine betaherpesvirus 2]QXV67850.1 helicase-primase subunit [Panine betaherpesvirus 2]